MSPGLLDIPIELREKILIYLSAEELTSALCLNGSLYRTIKNSTDIQYSIALQKYGMVDGDTSWPITDRLVELLRMEEAWRTLDLSRRVSVKVPQRLNLSGIPRIHDLSDGVYTICECTLPAETHSAESFRYFNLSRCATGPRVVHEDAWCEMSIPPRTVDFGSALQEHDLIANISLREIENGGADEIVLHLRQFSTGLSHPLANRPEVVVGCANRLWNKCTILMEIVGPCLMLLLSWPLSTQQNNIEVLLLVNWWTGEIVIREEWPTRTYGGIIFLTHDLIMLPNLSAKTFEVLQLPDLTKAANTSFGAFKRIANLHLPQMHEYCGIFSVTCRADPNPLGAPHPNSHANLGWQKFRERPFFTDASRALVLAQFELHNNEFPVAARGHWVVNWDRLNLVVPRHVLVEAVRTHVRLHGQGRSSTTTDDECLEEDPIVDIPWTQWGPGNARWYKSSTRTVRRTATISGQRIIELDTHKYYMVKDFSPYAVQRMRAALKPVQCREEVEGELWLNDFTRARLIESHYRSDSDWSYLKKIFSDEVEANELPFVKTVSIMALEGGARMDEERIVGVKRDRNTGTVDEFEVFSM